MGWLTRYPIVSIALLLVCCIRYEENTATSSFVVPGLAGGIVVLCIIGIVLLFRIINAVEELCRSKGWLKQPLNRKYDILIPIGIVAVAFKSTSVGPQIQGMHDDKVREWVFQWSDADLDEHFILALVAVVLLLRVLDLLRGLRRSGVVSA